ncbi:50S ribosomal protein L35 [Bacteroidetes/Chlorobi group bacterium MS-B_bin-24]|jgi:large subunit ribosomal protein L35|nr:MAG: 50S ribosomal protein L35 [Bacteroidetes/Chlorobi group bacterium MS-B_bin-24]
MPKLKTKSSAKKRFKVTATGKLLREKAYRSHILTKKERKRKRNLRKPTLVDPSDAPRIKKMLGLA